MITGGLTGLNSNTLEKLDLLGSSPGPITYKK